MEFHLSFSQWLGLISYATTLLGSIGIGVWYLAKLVGKVEEMGTALKAALARQDNHESRLNTLEEWKRVVERWFGPKE